MDLELAPTGHRERARTFFEGNRLHNRKDEIADVDPSVVGHIHTTVHVLHALNSEPVDAIANEVHLHIPAMVGGDRDSLYKDRAAIEKNGGEGSDELEIDLTSRSTRRRTEETACHA